MAHRNELVFKNAMLDYPCFAVLEKNVNTLYSFYHSSGKRTGDLLDFGGELDETVYALNKIYHVRW